MTFQPYPKLLYIDRGSYKQANDEAEHKALLEQGYVDFHDLPPLNPDGLELLTDDQLREKLLGLARAVIWSRSRAEVIFQIRFQAEAADVARQIAETPAEAAPAADSDSEEIIYGSSRHPETIEVAGEPVDIGPVVRSAFVDSGMTVADWNAASADMRDNLIQLTIDRLHEAGQDAAIAELSADGADPTPREEPAADAVIEGEAVVVGEGQAFADEPAEADPLDHDADGQRGGAPGLSEAVLKLRADLDALGVKYDKRWREERLTQALDEATKG